MSSHSDSALDDSADYTVSTEDRSLNSDKERKSPLLSPCSSTHFTDVISQTACSSNCPPSIIVYSHHKSNNKKDYVSEDFVQRFNERIGDENNTLKAKRLMKKMRILAGLHPASTPENIDISAARMGFALLAGLNHHELKMEALNHLEYLLENDPITEASSIRLVALTIKVMNQLDRELMQTEILEVQVNSAKIYGLLAELIQRHFATKHINAITDDLRSQLLKTARALRDLNRLEDSRLDFHVESALEGIKRILDDHKALYEIVNRLYNGAMLGVSFYFRDLTNAPQYTEGSFGEIDLKIKFSWYDAAMTILQLGRESMNDSTKLAALQKFVFDHAKKLNWRFLYLAIDLLTNIALNSPDPKIRKSAFSGNHFYEEFPGILSYTNCSLLGKNLDVKPVVHLQRPKMSNHDGTIRLAIAKSLIKLSDESPDLFIRKRARTEFLGHLKTETSKKVREYMMREFKKVQGRELSWINEEPPFDIYPIKKKEPDTSSLTPRRTVDFSTLFYHTLTPSHN